MKDFGICLHAYVPMRSEPSERAEQVSQLLFGELFTILDRHRTSFLLIKMDFDGYEGWVDTASVQQISDERYSSLTIKTPDIVKSRVADLIPQKKDIYPLPVGAGSEIRFTSGLINIRGINYAIEKSDLADLNESFEEIVQNGMRNFINIPYIWGGRSSFGADCSGVVQNIYKQAGLSIPRDASKQSQIGQTLSFLSEGKTGDLVFFDNEEGEINHVGILTGNDTIFHASGRVKIEKIDHQGIFSKEKNQYTHKLRVIKRFNV